jgi:predicted ATPase
MINSIKINNLRSLRNTGYIQLRPLTILLGANSSGKSTFLRSFPLFTQSVKKNLRGPISWFDDSLVDFGDYATAKNRSAGSDEYIRFSYCIDFPDGIEYGYRFVEDQFVYLGKSPFKTANIGISYANDAKGTYVNRIRLRVKDHIVKLSIPERNAPVKFILNDKEIDFPFNWTWNNYTTQNILPSFVGTTDEKAHVGDFYQANLRYLAQVLISKYNRRLRTTKKVVLDFLKWKQDKSEYLDYLQTGVCLVALQKAASSWTIETKEFLDIYNYITAVNIISLLPVIDRNLSDFYFHCSYIAPTRAEANRFYRTQGLQVNDIDPYGKNLEEFLSSLTLTQERSYNEYIHRLLKINIKTTSSAGHHSIELITAQGNFNMADVGFGYSQSLPIVTKLWYVGFLYSNRQRLRKIRDRELNSVLAAIEQPELHLHPNYQAKMADAFIDLLNMTKEARASFQLLVETHSQTIINRIGRRIREGKMNASDVNIVLFNKSIGDAFTEIEQVSFDENGQLTNWPFNFFSPED